MVPARQSTAKTIIVGPILDADGVAVTDGVVGDLKISKAGGDPAALNGSATLTHKHTGFYALALTASDLDTVGTAQVTIDDTTNAMQPFNLVVIEEAVYDAFYAASAPGYVANAPVNVEQFGGSNGTFASGRPEVKLGNVAHGGEAATLTTLGSFLGTVTASGGITADITGNLNGSVSGLVGGIADGGILRTSFDADTGLRFQTGTVDSSTNTTLVVDTPVSFDADVNWTGQRIVITSGGSGGQGQERIITAWDDGTATFTVDRDWDVNPQNGQVFVIQPAGVSTTTVDQADIADKLLGRNIAGGSDGGRTVAEALAANRNKVSFDVPASGQFTVYDTDDTTPLWVGTYTRSATSVNALTVIDPS